MALLFHSTAVLGTRSTLRPNVGGPYAARNADREEYHEGKQAADALTTVLCMGARMLQKLPVYVREMSAVKRIYEITKRILKKQLQSMSMLFVTSERTCPDRK